MEQCIKPCMSSGSPFECFGVPIEGASLEATLEQIHDGSVRWIVTANPEILLQAKSDKTYREVIKQADLRVADGFGLVLMARLFGASLTRTTGVELAEAIIAEAASKNWSVAFIGGGTGVAGRALEAQINKHPSLRGWAFEGGSVTSTGEGDDANDEMLQQLTMQPPDILFVAFGHPKQERWIARHLHELPNTKLAIGVGGTFDFWSGQATRAPEWMRFLGLEWLFRLFVEPKRWKRIWNAVVVFPIQFIAGRIATFS